MGPSTFFLPGIIGHLFSLQQLFHKGPGKLRSREGHTWCWPPAVRVTQEDKRKLGHFWFFLHGTVGQGGDTRPGSSEIIQELRNNQALFLGVEKTHTLGTRPDESQGRMATLLGRASEPDVCKQLVVTEGDWGSRDKAF